MIICGKTFTEHRFQAIYYSQFVRGAFFTFNCLYSTRYQREIVQQTGFIFKIAHMENYDTVSQAVNGLRERGYLVDFNLTANCLVCNGDTYSVNDFEITEVHRFEGNTDPSDEAVVYAIESIRNGIKGILVSGYGVSAEGMSAEMALKLSIHYK